MKKLVCVVFSVILCFSICSCKEKDKSDFLATENPSFNCKVNILYNDFSLCGNLFYRNSGNAVLEITSPEDISGLTFKSENGILTAQYDSLSFEINKKSSPQADIPQIIFSSLSSIKNSGKIEKNILNDKYFITTDFNSNEVELAFDKETGYLSSIICPSLNFSLKITEFILLN